MTVFKEETMGQDSYPFNVKTAKVPENKDIANGIKLRKEEGKEAANNSHMNF